MSEIKWTWNFDVYDESDAPTEAGYYRIIDDEGNEMTDYFFNEPRMTHHGIGYWRNAGRPIIAWRFLGKDEPQTNANQHAQHVESVEPTWTKEEHEAFYTFLWNAINPNEMQDYIEMFETKDEPQTVLEAVVEKQTDEDRRKMAESVRKAIKGEQTDCPWK